VGEKLKGGKGEEVFNRAIAAPPGGQARFLPLEEAADSVLYGKTQDRTGGGGIGEDKLRRMRGVEEKEKKVPLAKFGTFSGSRTSRSDEETSV